MPVVRRLPSLQLPVSSAREPQRTGPVHVLKVWLAQEGPRGLLTPAPLRAQLPPTLHLKSSGCNGGYVSSYMGPHS